VVFARKEIARLFARVTGTATVQPTAPPPPSPLRQRPIRGTKPAPTALAAPASAPEPVTAAPAATPPALVQAPPSPIPIPRPRAEGPRLAYERQSPHPAALPRRGIEGAIERRAPVAPTIVAAVPAVAPPSAPAIPPPPVAPTPLPSLVPPAVPAPAPPVATPPAPTPAPLAIAPAPAPAPSLGEEAKLLRRAIERLRQERDPAGALLTLDEHRARFPRGLLRADAELVRIEGLLALGREREALALLEPLDLAASPRGDELRATRGELRARTDCRRAIADFDVVLGRPVAAPLAERALRGRAVCLLRAGDRAGAERDLRAYLARFPGGELAREARARLQAPR
jgi:hypothetical protein